nr:hypothetical protein [Bacteroidota bacterium]
WIHIKIQFPADFEQELIEPAWDIDGRPWKLIQVLGLKGKHDMGKRIGEF